jgi:hypothetical protein
MRTGEFLFVELSAVVIVLHLPRFRLRNFGTDLNRKGTRSIPFLGSSDTHLPLFVADTSVLN